MSHLAIFIPSFQGGGAERVMVTLANAFTTRGHQVDLVVVSSEGPYRSDVSDAVRIVDFKRTRVLTALLPLARYLRRERPDALLSALTHANIVAITAKYLSGNVTRIAVSERSTPSKSLSVGFINQTLRQAIRFLYPHANAIISVSQGVSQDLNSVFGIKQEKSTVIYNPIDVAKIRSLMRETVSHAWLNEKKVPVILAAGRLTVAKDYPMLIRAFSILRKTRPAHLVILGRGEEELALKNLAKELNVDSDIYFAGFERNPYAWMHKCDLYVMSSSWEGLPSALLEALVCGARIISTDCPSGPAEILENGKWGQLVPVGDSEYLAKTLNEALNEHPMLTPTPFLTRFQMETVVDEYLTCMLDRSSKT